MERANEWVDTEVRPKLLRLLLLLLNVFADTPLMAICRRTTGKSWMRSSAVAFSILEDVRQKAICFAGSDDVYSKAWFKTRLIQRYREEEMLFAGKNGSLYIVNN